MSILSSMGVQPAHFGRRFGTRSTWLYVASLLGIAFATDILSQGWATSEYLWLAIPVGLALVGAAASLWGWAGAVGGMASTCIALLAWRTGHTRDLDLVDVLGATLYCITSLVLAMLALQRRSLEASLVEHEEQLEVALEREAELNRAKDDFLTLVAHELRNPVAVITGAATILTYKREPGEVRDELIKDIGLEARRVQYLVEELLALARLDAGFRPVAEPIRLQSLIPQVVAEFGERYGNEVHLGLQAGLPLAAGSIVQVERVLGNLLTNAGKYAPSDSGIDVSAITHDDHVEIDILDRGPGVPNEVARQIFETFYRQPGTESIRGYGLGLAISKRLVEANDGQIWARNREGGGLDVGFSLPLYQLPNFR